MMRNKVLIMIFLIYPSFVFGQFHTAKMYEKTKDVNLAVKRTNNIHKKVVINEIAKPKKERKPIIAKPLNKITITSKYGDRFHPILKKNKYHYGVDLRASSDTVFSVFSGYISSGEDNVLGKHLKVCNGENTAIYGHLSKVLHKKGYVSVGQPIGITGNTGRSTAEHLHFAVKMNNRFINSELLVKLLKSLEK